MVSRRNRTLITLSVFLAVWAWNASAAAVKGETGVNVGELSASQIEDQLQVCACFHALNLLAFRVAALQLHDRRHWSTVMSRAQHHRRLTIP